MTPQPLPRSLIPLPDESLPGYLLRLAHRLDLSPARLACLTGLAAASGRTPAGHMLALQPTTAATFAKATRLTTAEATSLTLTSLAARYPPVDLRFRGRQRLVHGVFVKENWIFSRFTRYCPQCLAGDGSVIQQRHGGAWSRLWRLPVVFACPRHQRLLEHTCPTCRRPALHRARGGQALLPHESNSTLHPAVCRNTVTDSRAPRACGQRLDHEHARPTPATDYLGELLNLQDQLMDLLRHDGSATTVSVGQPATPAQHFIDLRILTCLITASWPAAASLVTTAHHHALIDEHVHHTRQQITDDRRGVRMTHAHYDKPPADAATTAALLATAQAITNAGNADTVRAILAPLLDTEPASRPWARKFLPGDGYCSPGLHTALGPEVGALHIIKRTGIPHHAIRRRLPPPPRPVRFGVQHIPHRPLPAWISSHFDDFTDIAPRLLEHAVAVHLARTSLGGTIADAATQLDIPRQAADHAITVVNHTLAQTSRRTAFDQAIHNLAEHLDALTELTDYGKRRNALRAWEITPDQWQTLIAGLPQQRINGRRMTKTHWGDGKRTLATVWVWTHITSGDRLYAPAVLPDPQGRRPGGYHVHYVHTRWRFIDTGIPGHYAALRQRLDPYAQRIAEQIDAADTV
jgi:hypothetical protein